VPALQGVKARPTGIGRALKTYTIPIEGRAAGCLQRAFEHVRGGSGSRLGVEPSSERSIELVVLAHAMDSLPAATRSSASTAARMAAVARYSRDLNVPTAISSTLAASASGSPR
jgi:hypothetical protein